MSAVGPKRTSIAALHMSAFGGKADMAPRSARSCRPHVFRCSPGQRVSAISNDAGTFSLSITELTD
jgi:hypothetical protein